MMKRVFTLILSLILIFSFSAGFGANGTAYGGTIAEAEKAAGTLYMLGLMKGAAISDGKPDFELPRTMTREEAVTMLVRLKGEETAALSENHASPFYDVDDWAKPYVGYAYYKGYTNGTGENTFSGSDYVTASEYLTFLLRSLGYSSGKDFNWDTAWTFTDLLGLTSGEYDGSFSFLRGDAAMLSLRALSLTTKTGTDTLLSTLYQNGAVTKEAVGAVGLDSLLSPKAMSSGEIYAKSRESLFRITSYDASGSILAVGSGFFADGSSFDTSLPSEGLAVTTWSVIKNAAYAVITASDGRSYPVLGSYSFGEAEDLAVIKVGASGYTPLRLENSVQLKEDSAVFALSDSSAAEGKVTFAGGLNNGVSYIISTAPSLSIGSPLLDTFGRVVGITSSKGPGLSVSAGSLRTLTQTGFRRFSRESAYETASSVPDFGAYFGFEPVSINTDGNAYYYDVKSLYAAYPSAQDSYASLLNKWGFEFSGVETGRFFDYSLYKKSGVDVRFGTEILNGTEYFAVKLS